jgi:hypothetical protein
MSRIETGHLIDKLDSSQGAQMKNTTRSNVYVSMAALILAAAVVIPAAAQQLVPFKGTFQGNDTVTGATLVTSATGHGTLLGKLSFTQNVTINLTNLTDTGSAQWEAADGDIIYTTALGSAAPSDNPDYLKVAEIHTIRGGTGRFTGAQGSFTVDRMHRFAAESDGTHVTFGSFHGTITSPGAAH